MQLSHGAFRQAWCMQGLHATSMHGSLTKDLNNTDLSNIGNPQDIALMSMAGQQRLTHEQFGPAMNPRYEYKLPRGLGMAVHCTTNATETADEVVLHDPGEISVGNSVADSLRVGPEVDFQPQQDSPEVQACAGVGRGCCGHCMDDRCQHVVGPFTSASGMLSTDDAEGGSCLHVR